MELERLQWSLYYLGISELEANVASLVSNTSIPWRLKPMCTLRLNESDLSRVSFEIGLREVL